MPILPSMGVTYAATETNTGANFIQYLRFGFLGMRGSIRKRLRFISGGATLNDHAYTNVSLANPTGATAISLSTSNVTSNLNFIYNMPRATGSATFDRDSNGGVEVEFPFYSNNLFVFAFASDYVGNNPGGDQNMNTVWYRNFEFTANVFNTTAKTYGVASAIAAGEDFNFMRFQGGPCFTAT